VNGRIALADLELAGAKAEIALWGRNLTDNKQFANVATSRFIYPGNFQRQRSYGIDVNFEF
jgi:hypothetical protein